MTGSTPPSGGVPTPTTVTPFFDQLPARETASFPSLRITLQDPLVSSLSRRFCFLQVLFARSNL